MSAAPEVTITANHFATKAGALAEIARDDLWPVTLDQGAFPAAPIHCHAAPVRIYVLAGTLLVTTGHDRPAVPAPAGTRVDIPAGAAHTVSSDGPITTFAAFTTAATTAGLPQLPISTAA